MKLTCINRLLRLCAFFAISAIVLGYMGLFFASAGPEHQHLASLIPSLQISAAGSALAASVLGVCFMTASVETADERDGLQVVTLRDGSNWEGPGLFFFVAAMALIISAGSCRTSGDIAPRLLMGGTGLIFLIFHGYFFWNVAFNEMSSLGQPAERETPGVKSDDTVIPATIESPGQSIPESDVAQPPVSKESAATEETPTVAPEERPWFEGTCSTVSDGASAVKNFAYEQWEKHPYIIGGLGLVGAAGLGMYFGWLPSVFASAAPSVVASTTSVVASTTSVVASTTSVVASAAPSAASNVTATVIRGFQSGATMACDAPLGKWGVAGKCFESVWETGGKDALDCVMSGTTYHCNRRLAEIRAFNPEVERRRRLATMNRLQRCTRACTA